VLWTAGGAGRRSVRSATVGTGGGSMHLDRYEDWDVGETEAEIAPLTDRVDAPRTSPTNGRTGRRGGPRLPNALPSALAAVTLVAAMAFSVTTVGPLSLTAASTPTCEDEQGNPI